VEITRVAPPVQRLIELAGVGALLPLTAPAASGPSPALQWLQARA
jgi:hypothetical protein